jgi:Ca2+/Na+ antiporter
MEFELPYNQQKEIIITNNVTRIKRLFTILFFPVTLTFCFVFLYRVEMSHEGIAFTDMLIFLPIAVLFVFYVSNRMSKDLETKIILTNEKIIRKPPFSKEFRMSWSAIEKITIGPGHHLGPLQFLGGKNSLIFTRKKRKFLSIFFNHIHCPPGVEKYLSADAAKLILRNSALYHIPIEGKIELLEEISRNSMTDVLSQQTPAQRAKAEAQLGTKEVTKWYYRGWFIVLMLFFAAPLGIILMWIQKPRGKVLGKTSIRAFLTALWLGLILWQKTNR